MLSQWIPPVLAAVAAAAQPDGEPETHGRLAAPVSPFDHPGQPVAPQTSNSASDLQPTGVAPFTRARRPEQASTVPSEGEAPLDMVPARDAMTPVDAESPLGDGPPREVKKPLNPRTTLMTRFDVLFGPVWRVRRVDTLVSTSLEVGRMSGFSGTVHLELIPATQRNVVRALDVPFGAGALVRGRLPGKPLYGSVGLTAGILVHHAETDDRVVNRVDPDFRVPIRFAWTIASLGISLALVQGYSVRNRQYERRGGIVWARHAYRIGFAVGLHWDHIVGTGKARRARTGKRGKASG